MAAPQIPQAVWGTRLSVSLLGGQPCHFFAESDSATDGLASADIFFEKRRHQLPDFNIVGDYLRDALRLCVSARGISTTVVS